MHNQNNPDSVVWAERKNSESLNQYGHLIVEHFTAGRLLSTNGTGATGYPQAKGWVYPQAGVRE